MTLTQARVLLDKRLGRGYNKDADGQALLDYWLNAATRKIYEHTVLDFNVETISSSDGSWPTITNNEFTMPTTWKSILDICVRTTNTSSGTVDEFPVDWKQTGRTIRILSNNATPSQMTGHLKYVDVSSPTASFESAIWDYLIIEYADALASGARKDELDTMISRADPMFKDWLNSFSIREVNFPIMRGPEGIVINHQPGAGGIYTGGEFET